jgi:hypothetical protein
MPVEQSAEYKRLEAKDRLKESALCPFVNEDLFFPKNLFDIDGRRSHAEARSRPHLILGRKF